MYVSVLQLGTTCTRYSGGFEGSFATIKQFNGGLLELLGAPPQPNLVQAMMAEHCELSEGFGASDAVFVTSNYGGNRATPRQEWLHVVEPDKLAAPLSAGIGHGGRDLGVREQKPWQHYKDNLLLLLHRCLEPVH